jgi:hypothetical protein
MIFAASSGRRRRYRVAFGPGADSPLGERVAVERFRDARFPTGRHLDRRLIAAQLNLADTLPIEPANGGQQRQQIGLGDALRQRFQVYQRHDRFVSERARFCEA